VDTAADPVSDEHLMQAYAAGDVEAFEQLYARNRQRLFHFLLGQVRDRPLAEELFQDVWQRVVNARASWRPDAAFSTWLFKIAHNRLNDHWRAARHRPVTPIDADERTSRLTDPNTPESTVSHQAQQQRLRDALAELPLEQQEVVVLRLEQELSLEEIGQITGVGRETVKSRLRYAMDKLRAGLAE
jgi:RNA polymerase sigma factor (sigma-70 family)